MKKTREAQCGELWRANMAVPEVVKRSLRPIMEEFMAEQRVEIGVDQVRAPPPTYMYTTGCELAQFAFTALTM
jgi:hypothetical protein